MNNTNNNNMVRIPRIKGSTNLSISCSYTHTKAQLYSHILSHYLDNGFSYQGYRVSIEGLSELTGIPLEAIQQAIVDSSGVYARIFQPEQLEETLRALLGRAFWGTLGDRATTLKWLERLDGHLAENQSVGMTIKLGYLYQKSLDTLLKSNSQITSLITQILPKAPTQNFFFPMSGNGPKAGDEEPLSVSKAVELLGQSASNPLLLDSDQGHKALTLYDQYGLQDIEPILANPGDGVTVNPGSLITASEEFIDDVTEVTGH